jgi:hypothetical protein
MSHELFHAVQALAWLRLRSRRVRMCVKGLSEGEDVADYLGSLSAEGTASYVGDVLSLPEWGEDEIAARERTRFVGNLNLVGRSVTLLELSVDGLSTGAAVSPGDVYELGFYDDETMYALGYTMARARSREEGDRAIGELIGLSGAAFVDRYVPQELWHERASAGLAG